MLWPQHEELPLCANVRGGLPSTSRAQVAQEAVGGRQRTASNPVDSGKEGQGCHSPCKELRKELRGKILLGNVP